MKKILYVIMGLILVLVPIKGLALSADFSGYYCDSKEDLGDGTFQMVCHIVVNSSEEVSNITGTLILKNVTLKSIRTYDDWTSNNGLALNVSFTAREGHVGTYTVADLVYVGSLSDEECEASFMPDNISYEEPQNYVCMIVDDVYYGEDGSVVSLEEYYEQCCNYTCTVIDDEYYFDSQGNSVTYEEMMEDCSETDITVDPNEPIENPQTGINYGYIMLPIGIISIIVIIKVAKKNTKIYKI